MSVETTAGTEFAVFAGVPATYDAAGFAALSWVTIAEVTNMGDVGPEATLVTYDAIGNRVTKKLKGQINMGSQSIDLGQDLTDAGQAILKAAVTLSSGSIDQIHSFRITYKTGDIDYYTGLPLSYVTGLGDANQVTAASTVIEIDNELVPVAA